MTPNVRLQGLLRGKTWLCHVFPLNNPFGPSSLMPQSEINPPAHLHEREIKENLNYRVLYYSVTKVYLKNAEQETLLFLHHPEVLLKGY